MCHPDTLLVDEVQLVLVTFAGTPEVPPMSFKLDLLAILHLLLAGPGTKDVECRYLVDAVLHVVGFYPLVDPGHLIPPIHVARTAGPIVRQPD